MEALFALWFALFVSPLVLGAFVVVQDGEPRVVRRYFAFTTALFGVALVLGIIGLAILTLRY